jgi:cytochrome P450
MPMDETPVHETTPVYDPRDPATINDPIPHLRRLQQTEPVYWSDVLRGWVITRYEDVKRVLRNDNFSADRISPFFEAMPPEKQQPIKELIRYLNTWVAFKDPPEHTRLRQLMRTVFTPAAVAEMSGFIESAVDHLLAELEGKKQIDFIEEFAYPLPAMVILEMLGLPQSDMDLLKDWSNKMQLFIGSATTSPHKYALAEEGAIQMAAYFREVIRDREEHPGSDMITKLLAIRDSDDTLTEDEVIGTSMLFLFGGHETTTNLIGNGIRALLLHPDQMALLRNRPELIDSAVEEMLRYDGPTGASVRIVKESHQFHDKWLESGQRVFVMIHAANHDLDAFEAPDTFDITREPNHHLTFNYGAHFCMGAPLARLEGKIAMARLIEHFPNLTLSDDEFEYMDTMVMRGVRNMSVELV